MPLSYNSGIRIDSKTKTIFQSNIENDYLTYFNNTSVREALQVGFGDLCSINDQHIKPINRLIRGQKSKVPEAITRLPPHLFKKYYPKFYSGDFSFFNYVLPDVRDCNQNSMRHRCKAMPVLEPFLSTAYGISQMKRFASDDRVDITLGVFFSESIYYDFMSDMTKAQYCSPYV